MSDLAQIERRLNHLETLIEADKDFFDRRLCNAQIARRYGKDTRTISNWRKDPKRRFPAAEIDAGGRQYNWLSQLMEYDQLQFGKGD